VAQEIDINQQISLVEELIVQGVKAILIAPVDSKAIVPVLVKAQAQAFLIINLDNRIDADAAAAKRFAHHQLCRCGQRRGRPNVRRVSGAAAGRQEAERPMLEGIRGVDNAEARKRVFLTIAAGDPA
jgi:ribose transport system substrate-binding protein